MDRGRLIIPVSWFLRPVTGHTINRQANDHHTLSHWYGILLEQSSKTRSALNLQLPMMHGWISRYKVITISGNRRLRWFCVGWFLAFAFLTLATPTTPSWNLRIRNTHRRAETPTISPTHNSPAVTRPAELDRLIGTSQFLQHGIDPTEMARGTWKADKAVLPRPARGRAFILRKVKLRAKVDLRAEGGSSDQGPRGLPPLHLESPCSSRVIGQSVIR